MLTDRTALHYTRALIEASLDPFVTISPDGKIMDVNTAMERVTGVSRDRLIGSDFCRYFTEPEKVSASCKLAFFQDYVTDYLFAVRHVSGTVTEVLYNASVYRDESGNIVGLFAAGRDITKLRQSQREIEDNNREILILSQMTALLMSCQSVEEAFPVIEAAMGQLFPGASGACFMMNESGTLLEEISHWGRVRLSEMTFTPDECWALRRGHIHSVGLGQYIDLRCKHLEYETSPYVCVPLVAQGKALGIIYLSPDENNMDPTQLKRRYNLANSAADSISLALANLKLRDSLRLISLRDPLTGLFNRRFMDEAIIRELSRMRRMKKQMAIVMLDIDKFKNFNDHYGHETGDVVLKQVAGLLMNFRQGFDAACRYGGEEFLLMLPEISADNAMSRLEQLRQSVSDLIVSVNGRELPHITISIGIAIFPIHGTTPNMLINAADDALYQAKRTGRNRVVMSEAVQDEVPGN